VTTPRAGAAACWLALVLAVPGCTADDGSSMDDTQSTFGPGTDSGPNDPSGEDSTAGDPSGDPTADGSTSGTTGSTNPTDPTDPTNPTDPTEDDTGDDTGPMGGTPVEQHGALHVADGKLRNMNGQPVQLRGVSSMWLNWEDDGYAESLDALRYMRDEWDLSVIRAAMGVSEDGAYFEQPDKALMQVRTIVDNAIEAGVYVIIDWHDHEAHQHQGQAIEFFRNMAMEYGDVPNVLYETYNEPLQVSWNDQIRPYHEAVVGALREVDPDNVVILGTPNWSQFVHEAAMNPLQGENLMYTLHFYSCTHSNQIRDWGTQAVNAGLALFVTEWAATHADGGLDGQLCEGEADVWHDWMNQHDISWTAWKFDDCEPDSSCMLVPGAPLTGGWTQEQLRGHGPYVRDRMQN